MPNPQIPQGTLNRLRGTVTFTDFPELNVTASFLGKEGITLAWEGQTTTYIDTMVGRVVSSEPFQAIRVTINLLKTQGLSAAFEAQRLALALVGDMTVVTDAATQPTYPCLNCSIENVRELKINGQDAGYVVEMGGYYIVNNDAWDLP